MKSLIAITFLLSSFSTFALTVDYKCEAFAGIPVKLKIQKTATGSFWDYKGTLFAPGTDEVTGTYLRSKKTVMEGSVETEGGKKYFHFANPKVPSHQVMAQYSEKVGAKVEIMEIKENGKSQQVIKCVIEKFSK